MMCAYRSGPHRLLPAETTEKAHCDQIARSRRTYLFIVFDASVVKFVTVETAFPGIRPTLKSILLAVLTGNSPGSQDWEAVKALSSLDKKL
jgi:hypothetical protein